MVNFKPFTPYKLNFKLIRDDKFEILDKKTNITSEKAFYEIVNEIFEDDIPYKCEDLPVMTEGGGLLVEQGDKKILITKRDKSPWYLDQILGIILDIGKDYYDNELENFWLYVEDDYVLDDAYFYYNFFIANSEKILKQCAVLSGGPVDIPENILEVRNDYFKNSDQDYELAVIRRCYEKFYRETEHGQIVALKKKNEFEINTFGTLIPEIDNTNMSALFLKINQLQTQLKTITWLIVIVILFLIGGFPLFK